MQDFSKITEKRKDKLQMDFEVFGLKKC